MRKQVGRSEGGRREIGGVGVVKGEVLCAGRKRCLVGDGRGGGNKKRAK